MDTILAELQNMKDEIFQKIDESKQELATEIAGLKDDLKNQGKRIDQMEEQVHKIPEIIKRIDDIENQNKKIETYADVSAKEADSDNEKYKKKEVKRDNDEKTLMNLY